MRSPHHHDFRSACDHAGNKNFRIHIVESVARLAIVAVTLVAFHVALFDASPATAAEFHLDDSPLAALLAAKERSGCRSLSDMDSSLSHLHFEGRNWAHRRITCGSAIADPELSAVVRTCDAIAKNSTTHEIHPHVRAQAIDRKELAVQIDDQDFLLSQRHPFVLSARNVAAQTDVVPRFRMFPRT